MVKSGFCFFILFIMWADSFGQDCRGVSGKKNQEQRIEIFTGITNSEDFYSLLIQKEINLGNAGTPKYILYLNAASKVLLSDSVLDSKGSIEMQLLDGSKVIYENAKAYNNPLGYCCMLGFKVYLPEEEIKIFAENPIVTFKAFRILTTTFSTKKQKEQQRIINCLLNRN